MDHQWSDLAITVDRTNITVAAAAEVAMRPFKAMSTKDQEAAMGAGVRHMVMDHRTEVVISKDTATVPWSTGPAAETATTTSGRDIQITRWTSDRTVDAASRTNRASKGRPTTGLAAGTD